MPNPLDMLNTTYGYSGEFSPENAIELQALNRRRMITNALLHQGLQPAQGQMVGRFYVPASPLQHVANMGHALTGFFGDRAISDQQKDVALKDRQIYEEAIKAYQRKTAPQSAQVQASGPGAPVMTPAGQAFEQVASVNRGPSTGDPAQSLAMIERASPFFAEGEKPTATIMQPAPPEVHRQALIDLMAKQHPQLQRMGHLMMAMRERQDEKAEQREFQAREHALTREASVNRLQEQLANQLILLQASGANRDAIEQFKASVRDSIERLRQSGRDLRDPVQTVPVQDKTSPTGWSYADPKTGKITMSGAPMPSSAVQADKNASIKMKSLPGSVGSKFMENSQNLRMAERALALSQGKTVEGMKGDKEATGWKGYLPEGLLQRVDPAGVPTRAAVADLGSLIIHDRSGAAVTAAEYPRLKPFIPKENDYPDVVRQKLQKFVTEYHKIQEEMTSFYTDAGYDVPKSNWHLSPEIEETPATSGVAPFNDPEKERRYQEFKRKSR